MWPTVYYEVREVEIGLTKIKVFTKRLNIDVLKARQKIETRKCLVQRDELAGLSYSFSPIFPVNMCACVLENYFSK